MAPTNKRLSYHVWHGIGGYYYVTQDGSEIGPFQTEKSAEEHYAKYIAWMDQGCPSCKED